MNLIKISTQLYPYTIPELRRDYPNVSFPSNLTGINGSGYYTGNRGTTVQAT